MIAAWQSWQGRRRPPDEQIIAGLSRGANAIVARAHASGCVYGTAREVHPAAGGAAVALQGWIDNCAEIERLTGARCSDSTSAYAAALAEWGTRADRHLVGNYCAIARLPDGTLHLARSPWDAPPLYYASDPARTIASPLLAALFAAGVPRELDYDRVIDELAYDFREGDENGWYRDVRRVPLGARVRIAASGSKLDRWYDAGAFAGGWRGSDADCVEQASALLDEAAAAATAIADRPAIALSGGLDSSLAASALLRSIPEQESLPAITFVPDSEWDACDPPGLVGDEWPTVQRFAEMHPRIDLHRAEPKLGGFNFQSRDTLREMGVFSAGLANVGMYHGVYDTARRLGCDWLFNADLGNQSISDDGRWAYVEYARRGHWSQLLRLLRNRPGDTRSLARRVIALVIMPQLPAPVRRRLQQAVHPERKDMVAHLSPLGAAALAGQRARAATRGGGSAWEDFRFPADRAAAARADHAACDRTGSEIELAFEQLYCVRRRDVTAYRPLIEFCLSLPTRQFAWDGMERRLARRMAAGRMPETQRLDTRHGQHNIDWHVRIGRQRDDLIAYCETMRDHEWLSQTLDIDRLQHLLSDWPEEAGMDMDADWPRAMAIPRAVLAAQFIGIAEGRNDL